MKEGWMKDDEWWMMNEEWYDFKLLRGFADRQTDEQTNEQTNGQTDIGDCRVTFATENSLSYVE